jgi:glutamate/aspartate transport system substrate-binding protein
MVVDLSDQPAQRAGPPPAIGDRRGSGGRARRAPRKNPPEIARRHRVDEGGGMMRCIVKTTIALLLLLAAFSWQASAQDLGPTLAKIKEAATITVGHREASVPLSYLDDSQKPIGFSVALCGLVADKIKTKLGLRELNVAYQSVNSSNRIPLVKNATVDIECGSTANTIARQKEVGFSVSMYVPQFRWLARKDSGLTSSEDLKDKTVVVTQGTNTAQFVAKLNADKGLGMKILHAKDHAESFLLVESERASAFMEDDILLAGLKANAKNPDDFTWLADSYPSDPYALMFRKDDQPFKQLVDETLIEAMQAGVYDALYTRWFESPIPPRGINLAFPMSQKLKALISQPNDKANGQ